MLITILYAQQKQSGQKIENVEFYKMSCTKKDGSFVIATYEEKYVTNFSVLFDMDRLDGEFILLSLA